MSGPLKTVLFVDDSEDDRLLTTHAFKLAGLDCLRTVDSVPQALQYLRGEGCYSDRNKYPFPSLIVTDLKMPGLNGFDLLDTIRNDASTAAVPIVVLSSCDLGQDVADALHCGARAFYRKPAQLAELRDLVSKMYAYWCGGPSSQDDPGPDAL